jgi:predicted metal-dependent peptidase
MSKLSAEQRIERCHVQLMKHKNFALFSGLFMIGKVSVDDEVPTACTNGLDVRYGRTFVDRLNDKQLAFLILHENMHKAYRHLVVWEKLNKKNATLANMACDYVINLQIRDYDPNQYDTEMPTDEDGQVLGLIDEQYRGMDAHQVFLLLEKEKGSDYGKGKGKVKIVMVGDEEMVMAMVVGKAKVMATENLKGLTIMTGTVRKNYPKRNKRKLPRKSNRHYGKALSS